MTYQQLPYVQKDQVVGETGEVYGAGIMPEKARQSPADPLYVATGVESIDTSVPQALDPYLALNIGVLGHLWPTSRRRTLHIGIPTRGGVPGGAFPTDSPNGIQSASLNAGAVDTAGLAMGTLAFGPNPALACVLEYGSGAAAHRVIMDWKQGSYNLPACSFVRVSAIPWGDWGVQANSRSSLNASVSADETPGAHVPTLSARGEFSAGVGRTFDVPEGARAFEVQNATSPQATVVELSSGIIATRNFATGAFNPPYSPIPVQPGANQVTITSSLDATLMIQWYLEL